MLSIDWRSLDDTVWKNMDIHDSVSNMIQESQILHMNKF